MFERVVIDIFYATIASTMIFGVINNLRSNFYDIRHAKLRRDRELHPFARHLRKRPLVNIIIYADNDAETVEDCLNVFVQNSYKKLNIVVVDNASRDDTPKLVRRFKKSHSSLALRTVNKRTRCTREQAFLQVSKHVKQGLVLVIDASTVIDANAIKNAVLLQAQTCAPAILLNNRIDHGYRLFGLSSKLRGIAAIRAKKSGGFVPGFDSYNYATIYTSGIFKILLEMRQVAGLNDINALRQSVPGLTFDSSAFAIAHKPVTHTMHRPASRHSIVNAVNHMRSILTLVEPLLACFMVYVAIAFSNPGYIALAWACFTFLLVLAIWSDDSRGFIAKLRLSLLALVSYGLYIIQSLQSLVRLMYNSRYGAIQR
ncbi:MAG: glycosyltransferase [Candidatus Saccharimonadales bacterium]